MANQRVMSRQLHTSLHKVRAALQNHSRGPGSCEEQRGCRSRSISISHFRSAWFEPLRQAEGSFCLHGVSCLKVTEGQRVCSSPPSLQQMQTQRSQTAPAQRA